MEVNISQAKRQLSGLLKRVAAGEEVVITKRGKPGARIEPTYLGEGSIARFSDGRVRRAGGF